MGRREKRPTDELIQLYVLEGFLERMAASPQAKDLVLKGGVLLAAYAARRPTRDIDLAGHNFSNDTQSVLTLVRSILGAPVDDGWSYGEPAVEVIRPDELLLRRAVKTEAPGLGLRRVTAAWLG